MRKFQIFTVLLSLLAVCLSFFTLLKIEGLQTTSTPASLIRVGDPGRPLNKLLLDRVRACIENNNEIKQKEEIFVLLDKLEEQGMTLDVGSDDLRVKYVHTQACLEHILACSMVLHEIENLVGVIHTPNPATPLCTRPDNLDKQLLDNSIQYDLEKLLTVRSRAVIVRDFLDKKGKLYIAYPKGGLEKRTLEQQTIYKEELERYAGYLFDAVLSCSSMEPELVGATYFFKGGSQEIYAFSIKARQANNPAEQSSWALWLGKVEDPNISQRVVEILDFLEENGGPRIYQDLARL